MAYSLLIQLECKMDLSLYKKSKITVSICEFRNLRSVAYLITEAAKKERKMLVFIVTNKVETMHFSASRFSF